MQEQANLLEDLFQAYFDARKNKRQTYTALKFEDKLEKNILELYNEIISGRYEPAQSICFIVNHPVKREIFAADFRDRIVHHLIYNYINPIFEKHFIHDTYSCRLGKGTHFGIKRLDHFIRSCSDNYQKDCYILKLDIKGYFMSMNKSILYRQVKQRLFDYEKKGKVSFDLALVLNLIRKTIFCDPTIGCKVKGTSKDWLNLPRDKSLFYSGNDKGLPIGNLTSQLFGNVYLNDFDYFVKHTLGCKYYGRYVDDFFILSKNKRFLKDLVLSLREYLREKLGLDIHSNKIYFQHFSKGVDFLGAYLKPHRIYYRNKNKAEAIKRIRGWNKRVINNNIILSCEELESFSSFLNSVLGLMKHCNSYKLRKKILRKDVSIYFYNYIFLSRRHDKVNIRDWLINTAFN